MLRFADMMHRCWRPTDCKHGANYIDVMQTARGVMEKAIIAVEKDLMTTYESATASAKRRWADINAELSIEP